jgi:hypothetical protein
MKLKLNLEDLSVDSFDTVRSGKARGTVFGEQCTCWTYCGQNTCPGCPTCDGTCNGTCAGDTCAGTCNSCAESCYYDCASAANSNCTPYACN